MWYAIEISGTFYEIIKMVVPKNAYIVISTKGRNLNVHVFLVLSYISVYVWTMANLI